MPLFKGQGCKSTPRKAINYVTDENKAAYISSLNLDDDRDYATQFRETMQLFGKGNKYDERKYYHFKLSCDRVDNVSAADHHKYAEDIAKILFGDQYEVIVATHTDTQTVHSHIIVNAINFVDGRKLHCNNRQYELYKDIVNDIGRERGYSTLDYRQPAKDKITSKEMVIKLHGGKVWKDDLRQVIQEAKKTALSMNDFEKKLNTKGVTLTRNTEKTIAYKHPDRSKSIRGEKLGADYTKEAITAAIEQNRTRKSEKRAERLEKIKDTVKSMGNRLSRLARKNPKSKNQDESVEIAKDVNVIDLSTVSETSHNISPELEAILYSKKKSVIEMYTSTKPTQEYSYARPDPEASEASNSPIEPDLGSGRYRSYSRPDPEASETMYTGRRNIKEWMQKGREEEEQHWNQDWEDYYHRPSHRGGDAR